MFRDFATRSDDYFRNHSVMANDTGEVIWIMARNQFQYGLESE